MKPPPAHDPEVHPRISQVVSDALTAVSTPTDWIIVLLLVTAALLIGVLFSRRIKQALAEQFVWRTLAEYLATPVLALLILMLARAAGGVFDNALMGLASVLLFLYCVVRTAGAIVELLFRPTMALRVLLRLTTVVVWVETVLRVFGQKNPEISRFFAASVSVGGSDLSVEGIFRGIVLGVVIVIVAFWVDKALDGALRRSQSLQPNYLLGLSRVANVMVWVAALVLIFSISGINLTALAAFSGALGIGLGLGLQRLAASYISGLIVLFEQSVRVGDNISTNNITGCVTRMTVRYTMIRTRDGIEAIVPNDSLTSNTIVNQSWSDRDLRLSCGVLVEGDTDTAAARSIFMRAVAAQPRVLQHPAPNIYVTGITDKGIQMDAHFWIADPENGQHNVISDIYDVTLKGFKDDGIHLVAQRRLQAE